MSNDESPPLIGPYAITIDNWSCKLLFHVKNCLCIEKKLTGKLLDATTVFGTVMNNNCCSVSLLMKAGGENKTLGEGENLFHFLQSKQKENRDC